jgi:hypothetical protein
MRVAAVDGIKTDKLKQYFETHKMLVKYYFFLMKVKEFYKYFKMIC